ncbi:hypothetical protein Hdeb2414_s0028g00697551 [Helianthus debilis subsp. tardiflorus]
MLLIRHWMLLSDEMATISDDDDDDDDDDDVTVAMMVMVEGDGGWRLKMKCGGGVL